MHHLIKVALVLSILGTACKDDGEEERRRNAARVYGDPNTPGTRAYKERREGEAAAAETRRGQQEETAARANCDKDAEAKRSAWLYRTEAKFDNASPYATGFRVEGACNRKLVGRGLDCSVDSVRGVEGDSPFLKSAVEFGFEIYACEELGAESAIKRRVEHPIRSVYNGK